MELTNTPNTESMSSPENAIVPRQDHCGCSCYPNGFFVLIMAQILFTAAVGLSAASMLDCRFVVADIFVDSTGPGNTTLLDDLLSQDRTGLGFFNHQDISGDCHWKDWNNEEDKGEFTIYADNYIDWLGDEWKIGGAMGSTAAILGFFLWFWLLVFSCVAHIRPLRYLVGSVSALILVSFQFATLSALNSTFCDDHNCSFDRSAGFSVAAGMLFFFAGVLLFLTHDYHGLQSQEHHATVIQDEALKGQENGQPQESGGFQEDVEETAATHTNNNEDEHFPLSVDETDEAVGAQNVKPETNSTSAVVY